MSESKSSKPSPSVPSSTIPTDLDFLRSATAKSSRPSSPEPEKSPMATPPRLITPPPGERKTPTSHRHNRHAPVMGPVFGPMVSTPRGLMPLLPLATQQGSRAPAVPPGRIGRLGTIGEVEAEAEDAELQKEAEGEKKKENYGVRKIRFEEYQSKPDNKHKE